MGTQHTGASALTSLTGAVFLLGGCLLNEAVDTKLSTVYGP